MERWGDFCTLSVNLDLRIHRVIWKSTFLERTPSRGGHEKVYSLYTCENFDNCERPLNWRRYRQDRFNAKLEAYLVLNSREQSYNGSATPTNLYWTCISHTSMAPEHSFHIIKSTISTHIQYIISDPCPNNTPFKQSIISLTCWHRFSMSMSKSYFDFIDI
jgi:hypothetical protein